MATLLLTSCCRTFLLLSCFVSFQLFFVAAFKYDVGEDFGWAIPPANNTNMYNKWASENRFQIGDTVVFKYKEDSVMMVREEGYDSCNAASPIHYYNDGDTTVMLDDAGFYYFISGLSSHCDKGQKMIIKVMAHPKPPEGSPPSPDAENSGAVALDRVSSLGLVQFCVLILGLLYVQS
ncbi:early nodulin-like protein 21 [Aristolochia californica]|uniref:early nodulin-like protein 21 n=1 Tax=Aristolochia californica TaxID=171875 RepID=UPI0035E217A0